MLQEFLKIIILDKVILPAHNKSANSIAVAAHSWPAPDYSLPGDMQTGTFPVIFPVEITISSAGFFVYLGMEYFVKQGSVVRTIWGSGDMIMFIFAGAAAEFALNKAVDWLYFTGRLPADPLGRLFSTVAYARLIVFSEKEKAHAAIDKMAYIHAGVEAKREMKIPDWAYRDVLFMLIDYSIRSYEVMRQKLTIDEKTAVFDTFYKVGARMGVQGLPDTFAAWLAMREAHLNNNMDYSRYTADLFTQYKKSLGPLRYFLLKEGQALVVPVQVRRLLHLKKFSLLTPILVIYKFSRRLKLDWFLKSLVLPDTYKAQVKDLDVVHHYS